MSFERLVNIFSRTVAVIVTAVFLFYFMTEKLPKEIEFFSNTLKQQTTEDNSSKKDALKEDVLEIVPENISPLLKERILGNKEALVTLYDYSSITCSHCASFHKKTLPKIKKSFIDNGKVNFIFRDFPLGSRATTASMLSHCVDSSDYYPFLDILFDNQMKLVFARNPKEMLSGYARLEGMTEDEISKCLNDEKLFDGLQAIVKNAEKNHKINSTPTFVIDNGIRTVKIEGAQRFRAFKKILNEMIVEAEKNKLQ
ncbi:MAG: DsbA family protein [Alphaproteobacteria bacterium]|nr:DsbA family protein [Alphaproteobacteria bacterium]